MIPGEQRAEVLAALTCVDFVVLFDEPDPLRLVETLLPDVLVKGGDWAPDRIIGRGRRRESWGCGLFHSSHPGRFHDGDYSTNSKISIKFPRPSVTVTRVQ